ncbi:FMN-binding split barrel-related protein [Penicillium verhagenii]|uniref:FMN-binding split barrel-related protein n=1 Tax=Penicillium verhagenii TaxID=1562060 RepID=UPI0025452A2E|nr:FMN-binding split barrel-related protein [Penicillium verhagenii]KAJ5934727.1 FMN-binding split barrel-related protein [Penicillium verhagenii]
MHLRPDHAVRDLRTLHAFIRAHPLGVLTTSLPSENHPTLQCSHIPWVLDSNPPISPKADLAANANPTKLDNHPPFLGIMRGHIARANPQSKAMIEAVTEARAKRTSSSDPDTEQPQGSDLLPEDVMIVFTSPVDHYITPNFYTQGKVGGKVAPTWNYAAVQVYGRARIYHDSNEGGACTGEFLRSQLTDLASLGEEGVMGFRDGSGSQGSGTSSLGEAGGEHSPWKIAEAPKEYIATLLKNIVGMRIEITRIEGRFKVSQERPGVDRSGVVEGLEGMQSDRAREMAGFVKSGCVVSTSTSTCDK